MIEKFVKKFDENRENLRKVFSINHPADYKALVKSVIEILHDSTWESPDPERIHQIDDGDYQGTLVFVIGATGYQPSDYWYVTISYGSCSGCDTFESIRNYDDKAPTEEQVNDYMTLALHIVQRLKKFYGEG